METLKARRAWNEVFRVPNENNLNPRILYPEKLSFKIDGAIKVFIEMQKIKQYMTTKPHYKIFFREFCTQRGKANKTMKGQAVQKPQEKKRQQQGGRIKN
jgi:hypothetical protein